MKKVFLISVLAFCSIAAWAQGPLLDWTPGFISETQTGNVVITCNGAKGNMALNNYASLNDVYVHYGVITNLSTGPTNWKYVQTTWGVCNAANQCASIGSSKWTFTLPGNLRTHFGITNPAEKIVKIAILFKNSATTNTIVQRNSDASDMYVPVDTLGGMQIRFNQPPTEPRYIPWPEPINVAVGQSLAVQAVTNNSSTITLYLNGASINTGSSITSLSANPTITQPCGNELVAVGSNGTSTAKDTLKFYIGGGQVTTAALPAGTQDGINYDAGDTSVTLVLYAPNKQSVLATGTFNNWSTNCNDIMNKTPDGLRWWKKITGLTPGQLYKFQYLVDGSINTTDPYTELVLDPYDDQYITAATYPNMPTYPLGRTGFVGTFQTAQPAFNWTASNYTRPDKRNLRVYELLVRDFSTDHTFKVVKDSLKYLKGLGINCIELMPVNEFDGNNSWGYNPDFFFAPDKYYGTSNDLKTLIDEAHKLGIAVVMDVVLNHVTGNSPLAALYWNSATNKPSPTNPWLNEDAKHPFNVFNDFNHESDITKYHVSRFIRHWMTKYKVDGFRWDLAKGFTQVNSGSNVAQWGNYDASRVVIWKRYYDSMQAVSPNSFCILEFLGGDQEESELVNYGMLNWGKQTAEYNENTMGQTGNKDINRAYHKNRPGYTKLGLVTYAESHDEERTMYNNLQFGAMSGTYNVKDLNTALARQEAMHAALLMIPGPKMIWQFGELGYDLSINTCEDLTINNNCRLAPKPVRWNYYQVAERKNIYKAISKMNKLRDTIPNVFMNETVTTGTDFGNNFIKKIVLDHADGKVVTVCNFDLTSQNINTTFPANGKWYNFMDVADSISVSGGSKSITLAAGGYKIYTNKNFNGSASTNVGINDVAKNNVFACKLYPNPASQMVTIDIAAKQHGFCDVQILDATGRQVQVANKNAVGIDNTTIELNTSALSSGLYFVKITMLGAVQSMPLTIQ